MVWLTSSNGMSRQLLDTVSESVNSLTFGAGHARHEIGEELL